MARVRFNNLLASTDAIIGGKVAENMIMGGKVVWPVEAQFGASDGSALRAYFRALASQYQGGGYLDGSMAAGGPMSNVPANWSGFGSSAVQSKIMFPDMDESDPANTIEPMVADPTVDPGVLPVLPWMRGYYTPDPAAVPAGIRWKYPTTRYAGRVVTVEIGYGPAGPQLISGCFRLDHLAQTVSAGSSRDPAIFARTERVNRFESSHSTSGDGDWRDFGIYFSTGHAHYDNRGTIIVGAKTNSESNLKRLINNFAWKDPAAPSQTPELAIGETAIVVADNARAAWRKPGETTWHEISMPNPAYYGTPDVKSYLRVGNQSEGRLVSTASVACVLSLPGVTPDIFDLVKDAWDVYGA